MFTSKPFLASFKVIYRIAMCKKPHLTGESLVLPVATGTVETMFGGSYATEELQKILLAENTTGRRISDVSEDLCDILTDQLKISHSAI
jgi:hypothetical protein